ncbi:selection and upkeep of intraepithelial T-cells protein 8-like [Callospermophilus lateralis]|uniref:selection and upkeep of intraepithelial T-cells protein 8-like n=1 Tax=Callospermophilus lateralis TaxID=76772 RepID=UPI0040543667
MMEPASSYFSGYCMCLILLHMMTLTSEKLMVTVPKGHVVARVGGQAALSCQLSPPQSAEHMEVRWFKGDNSQFVYLYRGGHEVNGEAAPEYVNRTEFVKEAMGEGKVTLKIHNVSISDGGPYRCSFKETDFSDAAGMNLSVAALGLETQIHVQVPASDGLVVVCNSGGWFPQPQMEWRNSRGEVIPHSSKSYSQDGARLFHMKMTLLLRNRSESIMCYVRNPVTGEEKRTSISLASECSISSSLLHSQTPFEFSISDPLFSLYNSWMTDVMIGVVVLTVFFTILIGYLIWSLRESSSKWHRAHDGLQAPDLWSWFLCVQPLVQKHPS